jgi:hypothetical protein
MAILTASEIIAEPTTARVLLWQRTFAVQPGE